MVIMIHSTTLSHNLMKHFVSCDIYLRSLSLFHAMVSFILNFRSCVWDAADYVGGLSLHLQFSLRGQSHSPAEHHTDLRTETKLWRFGANFCGWPLAVVELDYPCEHFILIAAVL